MANRGNTRGNSEHLVLDRPFGGFCIGDPALHPRRDPLVDVHDRRLSDRSPRQAGSNSLLALTSDVVTEHTRLCVKQLICDRRLAAHQAVTDAGARIRDVAVGVAAARRRTGVIWL